MRRCLLLDAWCLVEILNTKKKSMRKIFPDFFVLITALVTCTMCALSQCVIDDEHSVSLVMHSDALCVPHCNLMLVVLYPRRGCLHSLCWYVWIAFYFVELALFVNIRLSIQYDEYVEISLLETSPTTDQLNLNFCQSFVSMLHIFFS